MMGSFAALESGRCGEGGIFGKRTISWIHGAPTFPPRLRREAGTLGKGAFFGGNALAAHASYFALFLGAHRGEPAFRLGRVFHVNNLL